MGTLCLDHIVLAVANLEEGMAVFEQQTGCRPILGGPHPGNGTCNALVAFEQGSYLEIIAPDPEQDLDSPRVRALQSLKQPELLHWAVGSNDLTSVQAEAKDAGFSPTAVFDMQRQTPEGELLRWQLLGLSQGREVRAGLTDQGGAVPFFIDWGGTPHPANALPSVGKLKQLKLSVTEPRYVQPLVPKLDYLTVSAGEPKLELEFGSANGEIRFSTERPAGFGF